jgi:hypothetical protein
MGAGTIGRSGKRRSDTQDISSTGRDGRRSFHACSTSPARSRGKNIAPAYSSATG